MSQVLVLNASYEPLRLVPLKKAVLLLLREKAELVDAAEELLRAQGFVTPRPLVIRLVRYIPLPRQAGMTCSRRRVFARDRDTCQYCGAQPGRKNLTLDHVVPRSQGGQTTWENVVAACGPCNHRKAGRTPEQAGMTLRSQPVAPRYLAFAIIEELEQNETWRRYVV